MICTMPAQVPALRPMLRQERTQHGVCAPRKFPKRIDRGCQSAGKWICQAPKRAADMDLVSLHCGGGLVLFQADRPVCNPASIGDLTQPAPAMASDALVVATESFLLTGISVGGPPKESKRPQGDTQVRWLHRGEE